MTTSVTEHSQILLRVAKGSTLDRVIRPMLVEGKAFTDADIREVFQINEGLRLINHAISWFDNISMENIRDGGSAKRLIHYTPVNIKPIASVSERLEALKIKASNVQVEVSSDNGHQAGQPSELGEEPIVWPEVPPQVQPHTNFIEPKWYKTMRLMVRAGRHIRLMGPPSVGKDTAIKQLAYDNGKPLVTLSGSSLREKHMTGARAQDASGRSYFIPSQFATAVVYGWWASITEINAADQDVMLYINMILEEPFTIILNGKSYPVHKDFRLFVSYNPGALGTRPLPASLCDRFFPIKLEFHNESGLRKVLEANGMPTSDLVTGEYGEYKDWTACLIKYAMALWESHVQGKIKYQITVRRCKDVCELMKDFRSDGIDGFKTACRAAIVDSIDNPLDAKEAERLLKNITC